MKWLYCSSFGLPELDFGPSVPLVVQLAEASSTNYIIDMHLITSMPKGNLFLYQGNLSAFEFENPKPSNQYVVFIGGLGDGFLTVPYLEPLLETVRKAGYTLIQILITSSYKGFASSSLVQDAKDIGALVKYLRIQRKASKVVLIGHSTGCQDIMEYFTKFEGYTQKETNGDYAIDGAVLQAPVSDRECIAMSLDLDKQIRLTEEYVEKNSPGDYSINLPTSLTENTFSAPISAERWLSFISVKGKDDYFSTDLDDDYLRGNFEKIDKPLLILHSGSDQFVPKDVDKQAVVDRWHRFLKKEYISKYSGVVKGAVHNIDMTQSEESSERDFLARVEGFLGEL